MIRILIIAIVVFTAAYLLIRGIYKRDKTNKDHSQVGWGESGVSESDGGSDE